MHHNRNKNTDVCIEMYGVAQTVSLANKEPAAISLTLVETIYCI